MGLEYERQVECLDDISGQVLAEYVAGLLDDVIDTVWSGRAGRTVEWDGTLERDTGI